MGIKDIYIMMFGIALTIGVMVALSAFDVPNIVGNTWWWIIIIADAIICTSLVFFLTHKKEEK
jgi:hypothetical protein